MIMPLIDDTGRIPDPPDPAYEQVLCSRNLLLSRRISGPQKIEAGRHSNY
jgi:hypothetical protein